MSKYIIDTETWANLFEVQRVGVYGIGNDIVTDEKTVWSRMFSLDELEELNSDYINEHYGELQDTAYQRGLNDAWEAARKVGHCKLWDDYTKDTGKPSVCAVAVLDHYTAYEAIAKLKAYEEKQKEDDKIEVGDEVIYNGTTKCIVVRPEDDERYASLIDSDGTHYSADHSECKKTGRHFDIKSILEAMKA